MLVTAGLGLTVIVTVNAAPTQLPDVGVTVYVAVWLVFVGLVRVPKMLAWLVPAAPPVIPPVTTGAGHVYVVPAGTIPSVTFTGETVNGTMLHVDAVMLVIAGLGLTVTVIVNAAPVQVAVAGVTV